MEKSASSSELDFTNDRPEEACGVFGIYAPGQDVSRLTYFGLHALQHRGQESAGIAVADGESTVVFKDMGLLPQVFDERKLASLIGHIAVGHVRYSTTGSTHWENSQPIHKTYEHGTLALVHNGNLLNSRRLRQELLENGSRLRSTSDTEVIASAIAKSVNMSIEEAVAEVMRRAIGAYAILIMTENELIAIRDAHGVRPLCIGKLGSGWIVASETCALDIVGADYVRDVAPGEMVIIDETGLRSAQILKPLKPSLCVFEFIYFARPDSRVKGKTLYAARMSMGMELAKEAPVEADMVIGLPDSGTPAAIGYAQESGIPFGEGLIKNRYVGRTFIQPDQALRQLGVKLKLNPLAEVIKDKRLVVVDDSIVRGNTSRQIVKVLKEAGAAEVHMRISSPPVTYPCFYGIDTDSQAQLLAASKNMDQICEFIGADSLTYLSFDGLVRATGFPREDFCLACFDGVYPIPLSDEQELGKVVLESQTTKK
ncbi:MAG TPA: amidophosphoribosyltransferase [Actinobacteria bacterium]|nr:amidophosphoribosyltransferase [Actinomycetota bacterium]